MEQIYYTQCPVGYGLGASNGFQVKRLSRGYPTSGDFRHLGLKAFPGGSRTMAPPALRYRRDGEVAEIAWLTPRPNEYETERGLWGRPGGHFAHGLRLEVGELKALRNWPGGLFESPIWKRTDREPSRGRPPEEVELTAAALIRPPDFEPASALVEGEGPDRLARLLTALAIVTKQARTLFLIDEPSRLGPMVAWLTFAFPEKFRPDLTFSTYHDRPEELPGYRISGTIPLARPNKPALTAQGIVADLTLGTFEPRIEPAEWARTLAAWMTRRDPVAEADWSATSARASAAKRPDPPESPWSDDWLGHLYSYPEALRSKATPADAHGWKGLADFARWLGKTGLADEWARPRNAAWWLEAAEFGKAVPEARDALVAHATNRETWRSEARPSGWGESVAAWFRDVDASERDGSIAAVLQAAPRASRPSFARALLRGLTPSGADAVLGRLRSDPNVDRAMLLPLEASASVAAILGGAEPGPLRAIVEEARERPGALVAVLEAVEAGLVDQPEWLDHFAEIMAGAFDLEAPGEGREGLAWALRRRGQAPTWLGPALRPVLADPGRQELWAALRDRTPEDSRAALARAVLAIADDPGLPDEAFRWGVESILLPLAPRPSDPSWAETYLRRTPSGLDLLRRLVAPEYRKRGVPSWLAQARGQGDVSVEQAARVDSCLEYAKALNSRDPNSLLHVHVPDVPPEDRGQLLGQMLGHVGGNSLEGLPFVLDAVRQAWPGAFEPGAPGLRSLSVPLARCLAGLALPPAPWLARLSSILERLKLADRNRDGLGPDGLAAECAASATRIAGAISDPWPLRRFLFDHRDAWRILSVDLRRDLIDVPPRKAPEVLERWSGQLNALGRFFELALNSSDGHRLIHLVATRTSELKTLPSIPWWKDGRTSGIEDLREGFARMVPMIPMPEGKLPPIKQWIERPDQRPLSAEALDRWRCLEAITEYRNARLHSSDPWEVVKGWYKALPLRSQPVLDRYRFFATLIKHLLPSEALQIQRLAAWMRKLGMNDPKRVARWFEEIQPFEEVTAEQVLHQAENVGTLSAELIRLIRDDRDSIESGSKG